MNQELGTIEKTVEKIKSGEISALELTEGYLKNIKEKNNDLNAYLEVFDDATEEAKKIDEKIKKGEEVGELAGIPLAIKDNILIKGKIASAGSKMLEGYKATYDATVIKKLRSADAILLGRTNMDEFAMGSSTENSAYGVTKNPYDDKRVAGGSSGGSATVVGGELALGALGSDTGGSIRQPAAFCGAVGLKPTYGSVSRSGLIAMASSLDQIGPITKTVEDAETLFNVIKGSDELDATSSQGPTLVEQRSDLGKLKIGFLKYDKTGVDDEINKMVDEAKEGFDKLGYEVSEIELKNSKYALPCYYIIQPAEASSNLARFDGIKYGLHKEGKDLMEDYLKTRQTGFGLEVKKRIMLGTYVLSSGYYDAYYNKAQEVKELIKKEFEEIFKKVDAIILPTTPTPAFKIGEKSNDPLSMYLEDIFTVSANITGTPAISIPAYRSDNKSLPIGLQILAPHFREDTLFHLGKEYERIATSH